MFFHYSQQESDSDLDDSQRLESVESLEENKIDLLKETLLKEKVAPDDFILITKPDSSDEFNNELDEIKHAFNIDFQYSIPENVKIKSQSEYEDKINRIFQYIIDYPQLDDQFIVKSLLNCHIPICHYFISKYNKKLAVNYLDKCKLINEFLIDNTDKRKFLFLINLAQAQVNLLDSNEPSDFSVFREIITYYQNSYAGMKEGLPEALEGLAIQQYYQAGKLEEKERLDLLNNSILLLKRSIDLLKNSISHASYDKTAKSLLITKQHLFLALLHLECNHPLSLATEILEQALALDQSAGNPAKSMRILILQKLANIYQKFPAKKDPKEFLDEASIYTELQQARAHSSDESTLDKITELQKKLDTNQLSYKEYYPVVLLSLGDIQFQQKNYSEAAKYYLKSLRVRQLQTQISAHDIACEKIQAVIVHLQNNNGVLNDVVEVLEHLKVLSSIQYELREILYGYHADKSADLEWIKSCESFLNSAIENAQYEKVNAIFKYWQGNFSTTNSDCLRTIQFFRLRYASHLWGKKKNADAEKIFSDLYDYWHIQSASEDGALFFRSFARFLESNHKYEEAISVYKESLLIFEMMNFTDPGHDLMALEIISLKKKIQELSDPDLILGDQEFAKQNFSAAFVAYKKSFERFTSQYEPDEDMIQQIKTKMMRAQDKAGTIQLHNHSALTVQFQQLVIEESEPEHKNRCTN